MARKTIISILLIIMGVSTALLVIFTYMMSGGKTALASPFLIAAIICIVTGSILAFSRLLDKQVNPVLDEMYKDLEDDIQDLKECRLTSTAWMIIITFLATLPFSFFVFRLHKLEAMWGSVPVVIPTLVGMLALAWFVPRTLWFKKPWDRTPMWVFLIPTIGLILTMFFGLSKTENMRINSTARQDVVEYNVYPSDSFFWTAADVGRLGFALDVPSCDGDECLVFLVIALVVLTLILVVGSALIPHFWLFSGSILLGIMALIAIRDLRVRPVKGV